MQEMCDSGRGPNKVQHALKANENGMWRVFEDTDGHRGSVEVKQTLQEGQNSSSVRRLCEGRKTEGQCPLGKHVIVSEV